MVFLSKSDIPLWNPILYSIIILFLINLILSIKYIDEDFVLPNQYIIIFGLVFYVINRKYFPKSIFILVGITIVFFFLFVNTGILFLSSSPEVSLLIGIGISFLLATLLLHRSKTKDFDQAIYKFLLYFNFSLVLFLFSSVRLTLYSDIDSTTWVDISLLILSFIGFILSLLPVGSDAYKKFKDEFEEVNWLFWDELKNTSGYKGLKSKFRKDIMEIKDSSNQVKIEWESGGKKAIVKRGIICVILLLVFLSLTYLLLKYNYFINIYIEMVFTRLNDYWKGLFDDNEQARKAFYLVIISGYILFLIVKLVIDIKQKCVVSNILNKINKLLLILMVFQILLLSFLNIYATNYITLSSLFIFIAIFVFNFVQQKLHKKGK